MIKKGLVACALCAALGAGSVTAASASGDSASGPAAVAAKKRCKKGQHLATVKRHGKRVKVCKKNAPVQGPTQGPQG
jgi:hypothetical protein